PRLRAFPYPTLFRSVGDEDDRRPRDRGRDRRRDDDEDPGDDVLDAARTGAHSVEEPDGPPRRQREQRPEPEALDEPVREPEGLRSEEHTSELQSREN